MSIYQANTGTLTASLVPVTTLQGGLLSHRTAEETEAVRDKLSHQDNAVSGGTKTEHEAHSLMEEKQEDFSEDQTFRPEKSQYPLTNSCR